MGYLLISISHLQRVYTILYYGLLVATYATSSLHHHNDISIIDDITEQKCKKKIVETCRRVNFDCPHNDISTIDDTTEQKCEIRCRETSGCVGYEFSQNLKKCWLKSFFANCRQSDDRIYGRIATPFK